MTASRATNIRVPYIDLAVRDEGLKSELLEAVDRVLSHGGYILGDEVEAFEAEFAAYCGTRYAVGVANGTDAIVLTLKALGVGEGDEVITVPNSFLASASAIAMAGARPVFVDVGDDYNLDPNLLEQAITPHTRAILPVHLTGRPADMSPILEVADGHGIPVVEDAAQTVGASYRGQRAGSIGIAGCFSFHPLKNLNAAGDGGMVTTDDDGIYQYLLKARNHGLRNRDECDFWSLNSRLDAIQAAMLRVKMKLLDGWTEARRGNAAFYQEHLAGLVQFPDDASDVYSVYHTFVAQSERRDSLRSYLDDIGIETKIHYPVPIHLQKAARYLGYGEGDFPMTEQQATRILTLPVYPELSPEQRDAVVAGIRDFYENYEIQGIK